MPVRVIPKNYRNLTGLVVNTKTHSMSAFESSLEKDFLLLLDFDPTVARYEEQPVTVVYRGAHGERHTYTPDVLVHYRFDPVASEPPKPRLYEVKYWDELRAHGADYKPKFKAAGRYAKARGWRFRLITERAIRTPYLGNVRFLRQYLTLALRPEVCHRLLITLADLGQTDPERLLAALAKDRWAQAHQLPVLWHLVARRRIGVDLSQPLTLHSPLWPVER